MKKLSMAVMGILGLACRAYAQMPASAVSRNAAMAAQAMSEMRLTADEPTVPGPVATPPPAQPVPDASDQGMVQLTSQDDPGLSLYRDIEAMYDLSIRGCSGSPCLGLWGIEESYAATFAGQYKSTIPYLYTADKSLGDAAHQLAARICKQTYTASDDNAYTTLYRMLFTQNETMTYLKAIQANAGRKGADVASCVPSELPVQ